MHPAFFIETDHEVADRYDMEEIAVSQIDPAQLEPRVEIVDAKLQSQDGEVPFSTNTPARFGETDNWNLEFLAQTDKVRVSLAPIGDAGVLLVEPADPAAQVRYIGDNAFYEADYRDQRPLAIVSTDADLPGQHFLPPPALAMLFGDGQLTPDGLDRIRSNRDVIKAGVKQADST